MNVSCIKSLRVNGHNIRKCYSSLTQASYNVKLNQAISNNSEEGILEVLEDMTKNQIDPDLEMFKAVVKFHKDRYNPNNPELEAMHQAQYTKLLKKVKDVYEDQKDKKETRE